MKQQDGHVPMDSRRRYHPHKETLTRLVLFQQLIIDMDSASVSVYTLRLRCRQSIPLLCG